MSASGSDRSSSPADALGLRRLSQLTGATEGSSALRLHEWGLSAPRRVSPAAGPAVLSLVQAGAPADRRPPLGPAPKQSAGCARPPVVADDVLREQAHGLAQALVEILAGDRTLTQLVRWTSAEVYEQLHHRVQTLASCPRPAPAVAASSAKRVQRRRPRPRVASIHVSNPTEDVAEVSARIDHGVRSTAIALRLERRPAARRVSTAAHVRVPQERWLCTAVTWA